MFCNQWGVKHLVPGTLYTGTYVSKHLVPESLGRRAYVRDLANLFEVAISVFGKNLHHIVFQDYGIHSTYWIWRSYHKDQWTGFEMVCQSRNSSRRSVSVTNDFRFITTSLIPLSWKKWQMHGHDFGVSRVHVLLQRKYTYGQMYVFTKKVDWTVAKT